MGELDIEGPPQLVTEWWEKLWPEVQAPATPVTIQRQAAPPTIVNSQTPDVFGEFYSEFRSDITDVDKVLVAAAFVQGKDGDKAFTTKNANQILLDQNVKVGNASECVRRLVVARRAFVVSDGRFRVSSIGFDYLKSIKVNPS
jgi:hypothetical protein